MIILLVEEIARLLTAEHIHSQLDAVLVDDVFLRQRAVKHAGEALHALFAANRVVVLQQQAVRLFACKQRVGNRLRKPFHAQRQHLKHDHPAETVGNHARQAVGLAVNQAAGIRARPVHHKAAVIARRLHAGSDQFVGDFLLAVGQQAHGNQRLAVVKARTHVAPAEIDDRHQTAVLDFALHALDFVAVYPRMALQQLFLPSVDNMNNRKIFHFFILKVTLGLCPNPHQEPEVLGSPTLRCAYATPNCLI